MDAAEETTSAQLAQLQKDLDAAKNSRLNTLVDAQLCLDGLMTRTTEVVKGVNAEPESQVKWWARAFVRQCQDAIDELTFLAPWTALLPSPKRLSDIPGIFDIPTLGELARLEMELLSATEHRLGLDATPEESEWLDEIRPLITEASRRARVRITAIEQLALRLGELSHMEYDFLFDKTRHLLAIGYNVTDRRRDSGYYDLLASEARLCIFVAIAQGQLPQESWFAHVVRLEGRQAVGARMPSGASPLDSIDLANIRDWIDQGARNN